MSDVNWTHVGRALGNTQITGFGNYGMRGFGAAPAFGASHRAVLQPWELSSPGMALYRRAYGQDEAGEDPNLAQAGAGLATLGVGLIAALVLFSVAVNYQLGKAMAPDERSEGKWAWGNAIGGTLFPPVTIGLAIYKNYFSD